MLLYIRRVDKRKQTGEKQMTSSVQIAAQKLTANIDLKTLKSIVEKTHAQKFGDLRKRSTWELAYYDLQQKPVKEETVTELDDMEFEPYYTSCDGNTCHATLPVLPEDEPITPPDCEFGLKMIQKSHQDDLEWCKQYDLPIYSDDAEEFRQLLDNSLLNDSRETPTVTVAPYQDIRTDDWFSSTLKSVVEMIKKHSRGRCDRLVMGFGGMVYQGQQYWEMTNRTPRSVYRRARRFISEIVKASKNLPYAQYSR
jgi:hypothetical protein